MIETVEELMAALADYPLKSKVRIWVKQGEPEGPQPAIALLPGKVVYHIDAVDNGCTTPDMVFLEITDR